MLYTRLYLDECRVNVSFVICIYTNMNERMNEPTNERISIIKPAIYVTLNMGIEICLVYTLGMVHV